MNSRIKQLASSGEAVINHHFIVFLPYADGPLSRPGPIIKSFVPDMRTLSREQRPWEDLSSAGSNSPEVQVRWALLATNFLKKIATEYFGALENYASVFLEEATLKFSNKCKLLISSMSNSWQTSICVVREYFYIFWKNASKNRRVVNHNPKNLRLSHTKRFIARLHQCISEFNF